MFPESADSQAALEPTGREKGMPALPSFQAWPENPSLKKRPSGWNGWQRPSAQAPKPLSSCPLPGSSGGLGVSGLPPAPECRSGPGSALRSRRKEAVECRRTWPRVAQQLPWDLPPSKHHQPLHSTRQSLLLPEGTEGCQRGPATTGLQSPHPAIRCHRGHPCLPPNRNSHPTSRVSFGQNLEGLRMEDSYWFTGVRFSFS